MSAFHLFLLDESGSASDSVLLQIRDSVVHIRDSVARLRSRFGIRLQGYAAGLQGYVADSRKGTEMGRTLRSFFANLLTDPQRRLNLIVRASQFEQTGSGYAPHTPGNAGRESVG
jgi:hypothetical protein